MFDWFDFVFSAVLGGCAFVVSVVLCKLQANRHRRRLKRGAF